MTPETEIARYIRALRSVVYYDPGRLPADHCAMEGAHMLRAAMNYAHRARYGAPRAATAPGAEHTRWPLDAGPGDATALVGARYEGRDLASDLATLIASDPAAAREARIIRAQAAAGALFTYGPAAWAEIVRTAPADAPIGSLAWMAGAPAEHVTAAYNGIAPAAGY